jgi:hypothetical protein
MAAYRAHVIPQEFGQDLVELAQLYNNAEIAVERLQEGGTVIQTITGEEQYWNVYKHKDWWKKEWQNTKEIVGFPTNQRNRPLALNRIRWFVAESPHLIHDIEFVKEALTFVREEKKGKPEATKGSHDDTVMCRAIAHAEKREIRRFSTGIPAPEEEGDTGCVYGLE